MIMGRSWREGPGAASPLGGPRYRDAMSDVDIAARLPQVTEHWPGQGVALHDDSSLR
jgi:hypothetical protein